MAVLESCLRACASTSGHVRISEEGVKAFAKRIVQDCHTNATGGDNQTETSSSENDVADGSVSLPALLARGLERTQGLPLRLESIEEEIDLLAILALLNIGSGFRRELHGRPRGGRGAADTMRFGVLGMALGGGGGVARALRADKLAESNVFDVAQNFQLPMTEEFEIMPGVRQDRDAPLRQLAESVQWCLADTGRILRARMCRGLGQFVLDHVEQHPREANSLVLALARAFPAFDDSYLIQGDRIQLLKKAQLLCADLYRALRTRDERFNFVDINELTVMSDNVLPAVLRTVGVLAFDDSLREKIDDGRLLASGSPQEVALRVNSVVACDMLGKELTALLGCSVPQIALDYYLWMLGKDAEFRAVERHATQDTRMY